MKKKVYELAQELKITVSALRIHLKNMGFEVKSHMSTVTDEMESKVREFFNATEREIKRSKLHIIYKKEREEIVKIGKLMAKNNLVLGTWGNISLRIKTTDYFAITPSGMDYDTIEPKDIVIVDLKGNIIDGKRKPSIELSLHLNIYDNRNDINAIVHTHSEYATAFAIAKKGIPGAAEDLVQIAGGDIRVSEYALPGSKELGINAVKALENRNAVILANHGCLAAASSLKEAFKVALIVEKSAKATIFATILDGVVELSQSDIDFMRDFYLHKYGQK